MYKDRTGQRFNRLVAIQPDKPSSNGRYWIFKCDCGKFKSILGSDVSKGNIRSCGCSLKDRQNARTHGLEGSRFYRIWININTRCKNEKNQKFQSYGKRGIKCLWQSFGDFKSDMYESYLQHVQIFGEKDTTIERTDNDGHYFKTNCRWATLLEQARNTRRNRFITINGVSKCVSEWASSNKIDPRKFSDRIKRGWDPIRALTQ